MDPLRFLIAEAAALGGGDLCASGHDWQSDGGRRCPRGSEHASQAVYRCRRCGVYDYGEPGGPGASDCEQPCTLSCAMAESDDDTVRG